MANLAQKISQYRKEKGLTQDELAKSLCVSRSLISLWELGKRLPDYEALVKMSVLFDVDIKELIDENDAIAAAFEINSISKEIRQFTDIEPSQMSLDDRVDVLIDFLSTLSKKDNEIVLGRYLFMKTYSSIAAELKMTESAVRARLSRVRKRINLFLREVKNDR